MALLRKPRMPKLARNEPSVYVAMTLRFSQSDRTSPGSSLVRQRPWKLDNYGHPLFAQVTHSADYLGRGQYHQQTKLARPYFLCNEVDVETSYAKRTRSVLEEKLARGLVEAKVSFNLFQLRVGT